MTDGSGHAATPQEISEPIRIALMKGLFAFYIKGDKHKGHWGIVLLARKSYTNNKYLAINSTHKG